VVRADAPPVAAHLAVVEHNLGRERPLG